MVEADRNNEPNILLVDDEPDGLLALEVSLEPLGYNLVKARSGPEACRQLLAGKEFALILLDVNMPGMDGYETAALIHGRPSCRHTPIIFLTAAREDDVNTRSGYTAGGVDYVFKPFDAAILRAKVSIFAELAHRARLAREEAAVAREEAALAREREGELRRQLAAQADRLNDLEAETRELVGRLQRASGMHDTGRAAPR